MKRLDNKIAVLPSKKPVATALGEDPHALPAIRDPAVMLEDRRSSIPLCLQCVGTPYNDEVYVLYAVRYLVKGPMKYMCYDLYHCQQDSLQVSSVLALAKVFYGLHRKDRTTLQAGIRLYGKGLKMLRVILDKPACHITAEIIISVLLLCVAEVYPPILLPSLMSPSID